MRVKSLVLNIFPIMLGIIFLSGCAAITGHNQSMKDFNNVLLSKKCDYTNIDEKIEDDDDTILWGIQGGSLARNCNNYKKSNIFFEQAEKKYKENVDKDSTIGNVAEGTASVLVNNNINDYEGNVYEKVMVNTYKALNYASLGDFTNARVEFNRALDRQRRAKDFFQKEIDAKKKEEDKKVKDEKAKNTQKSANNTKTNKVIYDKYNKLLNDFKAYPDFINPFTTYISGVYFFLNGDAKKSRGLFKEALRMDPKNKQIKSDYELSKKFSKKVKKTSKEKYAWIIYENGEGMVKDEINIHIPVFLLSKKVLYTGMALPKIVERKESYSYLDINGNKTVEISNMDNVIKTEFKKRFPLIVTEAVLNTVFKTFAQYELKRNTGLIGGLIGAAYQGLTNKADVRSWTALPKNFQSQRILLKGKKITIKDDKNVVIETFNIPKNKNALIYVKSQVQGNNIIKTVLF